MMRTATAILLVCFTVVFAITEAPIFFSEMQRADADRPRVGPAPPGTAEYDVGDGLQLWKWNLSGYPTQDLVDCTIRGKTDHGYVVVDDEVWGAQVDQTDVNQILEYLDREAPPESCSYLLEIIAHGGLRTRIGPVEVGPVENGAAAKLGLSTPYPSPSDGLVTFEYNIPGNAQARFAIYDLAGREVFGVDVSTNDPIVWDSSSAAPGMYIARLFRERWSVSRRLVIIR